jgi:hypothetical protein
MVADVEISSSSIFCHLLEFVVNTRFQQIHAHTVFARNITHTETTSDCVTVHSGSQITTDFVIAPNRFIVIKQWLWIFEGKLHQAFFQNSTFDLDNSSF